MNTIKISILVPIYGVERYIERCAISLFEQTYDNIEYIFVNDCTKDRSIEILLSVLEKYPYRKNQVKIISHDENQGLGGSRLTALKEATGDYIWQIDSDDWVETDAIEICFGELKAGKDIILFDYVGVNEQGVVNKIFHHTKVDVDYILTHYIGPSVWKHFIKRELIINNNIWPIVSISMAEDYLMMSRAYLVANEISIVQSKPLYHYVMMAPGSYSANINISRIEQICKAVLVIYDFYKKHDAISKHRIALTYSLLDKLELLYNYDRRNTLIVNLIGDLREMNSIFFLSIVRFFLNWQKVMKIIKKIIRYKALH